MIPISKALNSSVGKKFLMSLTGLGLVVFTIVHLLGNLLLFKKDPAIFNAYAAKLDSLGFLLTIAEVGLLLAFLIHIYMAITLKLKAMKARPISYSEVHTKGGPSRNNISSRHMIISGLLLLTFLIVHLTQFRFGFAAADKAMEGDLYAMVYRVFKNPYYVGFYEICIVMLGLHLRHGFWSAFQSLGAINSRTDKPVKILGIILAIALAAGFLGIPLWLYFDLGGAH